MVADVSAIPSHILTLADYEREAATRISDPSWRHIQEGCGLGMSLTANRAALDAIHLLPSRLTDLRGGSTAITLFGRPHATPILLAPLAYQKLAHPDGEMATVQAATALEIGMILSTLSSVSLEEVAIAAASAAVELERPASPLWFQLYWQDDRENSLALVRRAEAAGYEAIMFTVDASMKRASFTLPAGVRAANLPDAIISIQDATIGGPILFGTPLIERAPRWDDVAWLRRETKLPVIVKGLLTVADTKRAADLGADGVVLSNHGGRVFDGLPSGVAMLAAVREAMGSSFPLLVDGGIRSGTDVVKALTLGADSVLIGRPQFHALAVAGVAGVAHMLHLLRSELELAMTQLGCRTTADIVTASIWSPHAINEF